ncbi:hypothetical protein Lmor_0250 [Legionella moravica]|uniref:Uncharacterized protein n=1 Tax=Legionella moravica TaxID=39962 RepID=A0A378JT18_9GAMM|nr:hypothetical protein [Legionella moravica]KTD38526.1 hypothetical protein Lmor_0250 [Legionella moravica]STX61754.1 Uncharacterised protein [Legionella moravica]
MEDPFSALLKSLQSVFHLEAMRNGKYCYPAVQQLKDATERYNPNTKNSFIALLRALREALPHIEKWRVNFDAIRQSMDKMAKLHHMPSIDWNKMLSHPKVSPKFQFSALNHSRSEDNLLVWLTKKTGTPHTKMDHSELTQAMLDNQDRHGFSQKLNAHLEKQPDFLFNLIMQSEKNFIKISHSRLSLHLTDIQLAKAIIQHTPNMIQIQKDPFEQVELLIHKLNDILSNGRSVSTLLRNGKAKPILDASIFFKIYQSEEYANRHEKKPSVPTVVKSETFKPRL